MSKKRKRKKNKSAKRKKNGPIATIGLEDKNGVVGENLVINKLDYSKDAEWLPPSEENYLLDRAKIQWQTGEWDSLSNISSEMIEHNPDREKLALLVAAGHQQLNNLSELKWWVRKAQKWNCSNRLINQVLIAGVYNTLGNAAVISGHKKRALKYYESSISTVVTHKMHHRLAEMRVSTQSQRFSSTNHQVISDARLSTASNDTMNDVNVDIHRDGDFQNVVQLNLNNRHLRDAIDAWNRGDWKQLAGLDKSDLQNYPDRAELACFAAAGYQQLKDETGMDRCIDLALKWGCGKEKINELLSSGIDNTLAIINTLTGNYAAACKHFSDSISIRGNAANKERTEQRIKQQLQGLKKIDFQKTLNAIMAHFND